MVAKLLPNIYPFILGGQVPCGVQGPSLMRVQGMEAQPFAIQAFFFGHYFIFAYTFTYTCDRLLK